MNNIYLVQAQYFNIFNDKKQYWLPYSVGCLWAYAKTFSFVTDNFSLKDIIYYREEHDNILDRLDNPALVFFSNYTWNEQYNLKLAESIKKKFPKTLIVFGGPQTTNKHLKLSFIDIVVFYEGEQSFVDILKDYLERKNKKTYVSQRIDDLSCIPSPYTTGVFDDIISKHDDYWQVTIETNRGCPFGCSFCDWGSLTLSKIKKFSMLKIEEELKWIANNKISYVYLADANFGIFKERDYEIAILLKKYFDLSSVDGFFTNWTKNSSESVINIYKLLQKYSTRGLTLSTQSMNKNVLSAIKRKNLADNTYNLLFKKLDEERIPYYTEFILGLPNETLISWKDGLCNVLELGLHDRIDFWLAEALPNSELSQPGYLAKYDIKTKIISNNLDYHHNSDDIVELQRIIVSTNTMSSQDLVEAYMYAWMIQSFHSSGFSQIQSRLAHKKGVSYKTYYDKLFKKIQTTQPFKSFFFDLKAEVSKTFSIDNNSTSRFSGQLDKYSLEFLNKNIIAIYDLNNQILQEFKIKHRRLNKEVLQKIIFDTAAKRKKDNMSTLIKDLLA